MSDLGCSICQEPLSASAICVATKCGHVFHKTCVNQWITNSRTCPSCRASCTPSALIRLYFTTSGGDPSMRDLDSVTDKLIAAQEAQAKLRTENESLKNEVTKVTDKQKNLKKLVSTLDEMNKRKDHLLKCQTTQMKDYTAQKAKADAMAKQVAELQGLVAQMKAIETMMNSSAAEVEGMLNQEQSFKTMAFLVVNLKKELAMAVTKKNEMFTMNNTLNNKLKLQNQKLESLIDQYKALETELDALKKVREAEPRAKSPRMSWDVIPASPPVPSNPTPVIKADKEDSPYLRLAASSVGLTPLMRTGKGPVLVEKPKLIGNLQSLSIFADKQRVRTTVKPVLNPLPITSMMVEKENVQQPSSTRPSLPAFGLSSSSSATNAAKSDKFKIENRLKSGAIKRPTPYASSSK